MDVEKAYLAALTALRQYVKSRTTTRKDSRGGDWQDGFTLMSENDIKCEEIARVMTEAIALSDDGRPRMFVEACRLQIGDVFTRYDLVETRKANGKIETVAVDEEVKVIKIVRTDTRTGVQFRSMKTDDYGETGYEPHWLLTIYRPTAADLRKEFEDAIRD